MEALGIEWDYESTREVGPYRQIITDGEYAEKEMISEEEFERISQYGQETAPGIYHNIIKPCKRLVQKCSFKSVSDTSCLCSLAYWLYIYGNKALALKLCEIAHGADFSFEFEYWNNGIQNIYGLEIRIARELLGENRKVNFPMSFS